MNITVYNGMCTFLDGEDAEFTIDLWRGLTITQSIKLDRDYYNCPALDGNLFDSLRISVNSESGRVIIMNSDSRTLAKGRLT